MEFSIDELNRIIMDVPNQPSVHSSHLDPSSLSTTIKQEQPIKDEQPPPIMSDNIAARQYYLIIFSNRTWSQRLQKRPPQVIRISIPCPQ